MKQIVIFCLFIFSHVAIYQQQIETQDDLDLDLDLEFDFMQISDKFKTTHFPIFTFSYSF